MVENTRLALCYNYFITENNLRLVYMLSERKEIYKYDSIPVKMTKLI